MRKDFLVFGSPLIETPELKEVERVMLSGWLGTGPRVHQFEKDFASFKEVSNAAALNSATAGLHLSCLSLDLKPGDEVITTPLTFCATVNAIIHAGATPVLADIDLSTWNISPREIEKRLSPKTRVILPVHFAGRPCEMNQISELVKERNLFLIEDCAHAIESEYEGKKTGTFGDFGVFSFYATKNIVTGEGGMVISSSKERLDRIKILGLHGMSKDAWKRFSDSGYQHYYVEEAGFKYNMMDLQAAIGIHQLKRIDQYHRRREEIWNRYMAEFATLPVILPAPVPENTRHAFHIFNILIDEARAGISRDAFLDGMTKQNIGIGVHYLSIPEHPFYQRIYHWRPEDYPNAMKVGRETVSLPISAKLTDQDVTDVISAVHSLL